MQPISERAAPVLRAVGAETPRSSSTAETPRSPSAKGEATRARIIQHALELARDVGLESLSIGDLAQDLGLSKSGLFGHFGSKERLLLDVLDVAAEHFTDRIFGPAVQQPRGEPRLVALFETWLEQIHSRELPGGSCVFMASAFEWDDRQGPVRERVVSHFRTLHDALSRTVQVAIDEGQFRADLDADQFAHELHGILLQYHLEARLLRNRKATLHARRAFEHLLADARA
jgi:AcrR family transcriptional regulator